MAHHNSQGNNNLYSSGHVCNPLTPPSTAEVNNQQQQQLAIHTDDNDNIRVVSSQPVSSATLVSSQSVSLASSGSSHSASLTSSGSSMSMESTSSEVKTEDKLFDKIEDMICDYMREPYRHYLRCRVFRWRLDDDLTRQFSAVVIINPPTTRN